MGMPALGCLEGHYDGISRMSYCTELYFCPFWGIKLGKVEI